MISCISFSIFFMSRFLSFFLAGELLPSVCPSSQLELAFLNGLSPDGLTESRSSLLPSRPRLCTLPVMMDACRARAQSHCWASSRRRGTTSNKSGTDNNGQHHCSHWSENKYQEALSVSYKSHFQTSGACCQVYRWPAGWSPPPPQHGALSQKEAFVKRLLAFWWPLLHKQGQADLVSCAGTFLVVKKDEHPDPRGVPEDAVSAWLSSLPLQAAAHHRHCRVLAMAQGSQYLGLHWGQFSREIRILSVSKWELSLSKTELKIWN